MQSENQTQKEIEQPDQKQVPEKTITLEEKVIKSGHVEAKKEQKEEVKDPELAKELEDDEEMKQLSNAEKLLQELLKSVEQGEPTTLVQELLTELSSRVQLNLGPTLASQILGTSATSGMDLINKVLEDPQILWKKPFFNDLRGLTPDQSEIVHNWFTQMVDLQGIYISEIEKANDYLKLMVRQSFDSLHASESIKEEFIAKVNHIENRQYFHRKRSSLRQVYDRDSYQRSGSHHNPSNTQSTNPNMNRTHSGVRLPHKMYQQQYQQKHSTGRQDSFSARMAGGDRRRSANATGTREKSVDFKLVNQAEVSENKQEVSQVEADDSRQNVDNFVYKDTVNTSQPEAPPTIEKVDPEKTDHQEESNPTLEAKVIASEEKSDPELDVEGVGRFYDRIELQSYNYQKNNSKFRDNNQHQPRGILRNKPVQNSSSYHSGYYSQQQTSSYHAYDHNQRSGYQYSGRGQHQYEEQSYHNHRQSKYDNGRYHDQRGRYDYHQQSRYPTDQYHQGYQGVNPGASAMAQQYAHLNQSAQMQQDHRLVLQYYPPRPQYWRHKKPQQQQYPQQQRTYQRGRYPYHDQQHSQSEQQYEHDPYYGSTAPSYPAVHR